MKGKLNKVFLILYFISMFSQYSFAESRNKTYDEDIVNLFNSQSKQTFVEELDTDSVIKTYRSPTVLSDFEDDEVIVELTKEQSALKQEYTVRDFPLIDLERVKTYISFHSEGDIIILGLVLKEKSKENVILTISQLKNYSFVANAFPNYHVEIVSEEDSFNYFRNNTTDTHLSNSLSLRDSYFWEKMSDLSSRACCTRKYSDSIKNECVKVGIVGTYINQASTAATKTVKWYNCSSAVNTYFEDYSAPTSNHETDVANEIVRNSIYTPEGSYIEYNCPVCGDTTFVGTCPNVELYSLKITPYAPTTHCKLSYVLNVFNCAIANSIRVLLFPNVIKPSSIDDDDYDCYIDCLSSLNSTINNNYKGVIVTAATNTDTNNVFVFSESSDDTYNLDDANNLSVVFPVGLNSNKLVVVGSSNYNGYYHTLSIFSRYGANTVDLMAGGYTYSEMSHTMQAGTSFAAPRVAGAVAVLLNICPTLTPDQIVYYIKAGVDTSPALSGLCAFGGSLNVYKSAKLLISGMAVDGQAVFAGHFTKTDKMQVLAMCDIPSQNGMTDNYTTKFYVWDYLGSGSFSDPEHVNTNFSYFRLDLNNTRCAAGDFDGDSFDEIATVHHYQDHIMIQGFSSNYHFANGTPGYRIRPSNNTIGVSADCFSNRVVSGDFGGNGKDEFVGFYKDPNTWGRTKLYRWTFSGTGWNMTMTQSVVLDSGAGNYEASYANDRIVAGRFDPYDTTKDVIAVLYRYPAGNYSLQQFAVSGNTAQFSNLMYYQSGIDVSKMSGRLVKCNYVNNGVSLDEIVGVFDNSASVSAGIINYGYCFSFGALDWGVSPLYTSPANAFAAGSATKLVTAADFQNNSDGIEEIAAFYRYPTGVTGANRGKIFYCGSVINSGYSIAWSPA